MAENTTGVSSVNGLPKVTENRAIKINITQDGTFDIATGRHRKETNWKNREMLWSDLVKKLSSTHRTAETHAEYLTAKKQRQDEIKDIGGFVGGYISGGRRLKGRIVHRQLVTLDIDFGKMDIWDDFTLLYGAAACIYSTHKHAPEAPRLRLILPLDRPVTQDEYLAISRRIAGALGIENFDHTTFEPSRLMYWPSTAKDGAHFFDYQDGEWLKADDVLATYRDWTDSSEWPQSTRENTILHKAIQKQGDPLEKPGIVGAFCRTYSIEEAIETFLSDVYEPCAIPERYTYREGSTAAGVVIYEGKYAYSHHGTDPASGKLCNAFDLVRLHKFGLQDEDAREGTPINKMPSYVAMETFATNNERVRIQIGTERILNARGDFGELPEDNDSAWTASLSIGTNSKYKGTINNVATILENDPGLKGCFAIDGFRRKKVVMRNLPWRKVSEDTKYLVDEDEQNLVKYLEKWYDISSRSNIKDAFYTHLAGNIFHPVKDYLISLHWDGEDRVDTLLIDYLGAADTAYTKAVTRKTLVACVARIMQPGVKFDYILTLVGKQGTGKSTTIKKLGRGFYSDTFNFNMLHTKEAFEQIQGFWLVEIGELTGMKKADVEAAKQFISKTEDSYRAAFGRNVNTYKRQCVFFGTTNNKDFLRDPTGNRRFWPVETAAQLPAKNVFTDLTDGEVDQIWAEAVHLYRSGEELYLPKEIEAMAFDIQTEFTEKQEKAGMIENYLDMLLPDNWDEMNIHKRREFIAGVDELSGIGTIQRTKVCVAEIWCELFGGQTKDMTSFNTKDIHSIMQNIVGWERSKGNKRFKLYGPQRAYCRVEKRGKSVNAQTFNSVYIEN